MIHDFRFIFFLFVLYYYVSHPWDKSRGVGPRKGGSQDRFQRTHTLILTGMQMSFKNCPYGYTRVRKHNGSEVEMMYRGLLHGGVAGEMRIRPLKQKAVLLGRGSLPGTLDRLWTGRIGHLSRRRWLKGDVIRLFDNSSVQLGLEGRQELPALGGRQGVEDGQELPDLSRQTQGTNQRGKEDSGHRGDGGP